MHHVCYASEWSDCVELDAQVPAPDPPGVAGLGGPRPHPGLHHRYLRAEAQDMGVPSDSLHCGHRLPKPACEFRNCNN